MSHPSVDTTVASGGASVAPSPFADGPTFHLSPSAAAAAQGMTSAPASPTAAMTALAAAQAAAELQQQHQRASSTITFSTGPQVAQVNAPGQVSSPPTPQQASMTAAGGSLSLHVPGGSAAATPVSSPAPSVRGSNAVVKKGTLTKLGGNILTTWKIRFFVLREDDFTYYPSERDWLAGKAPLGRLRVDAQLRCWSEGANELEWKFVSVEKTVVVRGTLDCKKEWYDAIDDLVTRMVARAAAEGRILTRGDQGNCGRPPSPSVSRAATSTRHSIGGDGLPSSRRGSFTAAAGAIESSPEDDLFTSARETDIPTHTRTTSELSARGSPETPATAAARRMRGNSSGSFSNVNAPQATPRTSIMTPTSQLLASTPSASINGTSGTAVPVPAGSPTSLAARFAKRASKSRKAQALFGWGSSERVIRDFSCALEKTIMLHGRMFVSEHFLAFESKLFSGVKLCIPLADVISVCEANQALIFPNAIKVFVKLHAGSDSGSAGANSSTGNESAGESNAPGSALGVTDSSYFFGSFAPGNRNAALELITSLVNGTFDPARYGLDITEEMVAAAEARANFASSTNSAGASGSALREHSHVSSSMDSDDDPDAGFGMQDDDGGDDDDDEQLLPVPEGADESAATPTVPATPAAPVGSPASTRHLKRMSTHLDFGAARPPDAEVKGENELEFKPMVDDTMPGISAKVFWRLFLADAALHSAEKFHASQSGHSEYAASCWKDARLLDGGAPQSQGWSRVRDTMVRVPVIGSPMGPDSTRVLKVQKMGWKDGEKTLKIETVAVTPDVPFGDCFMLVDQWTITDDDSLSPAGCRISISLGIKFIKSNWKLRPIKSMLLARAFGDNQKGFAAQVEGMKSYVASHAPEVEAVRKAVAGGASGSSSGASATAKVRKSTETSRPKVAPAAHKSTALSAAPSSSSASKASTASSSTTPATGKVPAAAGLLASLPPPLQSLGLPMLGAVGAGVVLILSLLLYTLFGSSSSPSSSSSFPGSSHNASADATALTPMHGDAYAGLQRGGAAGVPWWITLVVLLLIAGVGALGLKVRQLEAELISLRADVDKIKKAQK